MGREIGLVQQDSTCIAAAGYAPEAEVLRIRYVGGATYDYLGVPAEMFAAFEVAGSKGRFVNFVIKPNFPYCHVLDA